MKLAIVLIGNLRTWDYCKSNFIETFSKYSPDVYLVTDTLRYGYHPCVQWTIGDGNDEPVDDNFIKNSFEGINLIEYKLMPRGTGTLKNCAPAFASHVGSYVQFEKLFLATEMIKESYDYVIKTRCDLLYTNQLENAFSAEKNIVTIDSSNEFPNDCIVISNQENMVSMATFMYKEVFSPIYPDSHHTEPHGLLRSAARYCNLEFKAMELIDSVVRKGNKHFSYKK